MNAPDADPAVSFTVEFLGRATTHAAVQRWAGLLALALEGGFLWACGAGAPGRRWWSTLDRWTGGRQTPLLDRLLGPGWLAGGLFLASVAVGLVLVTLPVDLAVDWWWARRTGTSTETLGHFLGASVIDVVRLSFGYGALGLTIDGVRRRFPRRWWLPLGAAGALVVVAVAMVEPYRAHAYYDVTPLPEGPLRTRLAGLLAARGSASHALVVIDASTVGPGVNAFVTGLGPTRRIVLTDTLLARGDDAVAGAVLHELGHRREERLPGRLLLVCLALPLVLLGVDRALSWRRRRGALSDAQAVPAVVALLSVAAFVLSPWQAWRGREEEREADAVELAARQDLQAYEREVVARALTDLEPPEPHPWDALFATHPSPMERIRAAREEAARRAR